MDKPIRVLVVEDSEDDHLLLVRELRRGGYNPFTVRVDTPEAMREALSEPWDLVVSDFIMPRFSGLAALDILRTSGRDIPFFIVSGKIGEETAVDAMRAGAHDYIVKGNFSRLVPAVERELRDAETRRRNRQAEEELRQYREQLEDMVEQRTEELRRANIQLQDEVAKRKIMDAELREHRDHLDLLVRERTAELRQVNRDLRGEIMRRIRMEKDLTESRRFVHRIADATPNLLYLYDVIDNKNIYVNPRVKEILGFSPEEIRKMGSFFLSLLHPDDARLMDARHARFAEVADGDILESEFRLRNARGEWRWFYSRDVIFKRTSDGMLKIILGIAQDITEKKEAEEELKKSREQLRRLLAHLQSVREDERTRISREIHDELGQSLTALKMDLAWMVRHMEKGQKQLIEKAQRMSQLVDVNIQTVKRISAELRPGILDHLGLSAALEWQAEEFRERTGIPCTLTIEADDSALDRDLATTIFRIFQETLTNVARHAGATKVRVNLAKSDLAVVLQVKDDGKGITRQQAGSPTSIGLIGMRERVNFLNGTLKISGVRNRGTTVVVRLPLTDGEKARE